METLHLRPLDPFCPAARALLDDADRYMAALYPAESNHLESPEALARPGVCFLGGYLAGELVACGAVKLMNDDGRYGEIKRVFIREGHRGRGFSRCLMEGLEEWLRKQGVHVARLETGIHQPEALGLYRQRGYTERQPFGRYRPDPLSVFMEKRLG